MTLDILTVIFNGLTLLCLALTCHYVKVARTLSEQRYRLLEAKMQVRLQELTQLVVSNSGITEETKLPQSKKPTKNNKAQQKAAKENVDETP
jgi:hypothetical protein